MLWPLQEVPLEVVTNAAEARVQAVDLSIPSIHKLTWLLED